MAGPYKILRQIDYGKLQMICYRGSTIHLRHRCSHRGLRMGSRGNSGCQEKGLAGLATMKTQSTHPDKELDEWKKQWKDRTDDHDHLDDDKEPPSSLRADFFRRGGDVTEQDGRGPSHLPRTLSWQHFMSYLGCTPLHSSFLPPL